jgi:hypothetical protein
LCVAGPTRRTQHDILEAYAVLFFKELPSS